MISYFFLNRTISPAAKQAFLVQPCMRVPTGFLCADYAYQDLPHQ